MSSKNGIYRSCEICNTKFYVQGFRVNDKMRGRFCSTKCQYITYKGKRRSPQTEFKPGEFAGDKHRLWKGDEVGYQALHRWINNHWDKKECDNCGAVEKLQWSNIDGQYIRSRIHWQVLCNSCHRIEDMNMPKIPLSRFSYGDIS